MKITQYTSVVKGSKEGFDHEAEKLIKDEWQPFGSISVGRSSDGLWIIGQAFVKYEKQEP